VNDVLLRALRGEPTPYTPVWFMRQAGRYQAEYRKLREQYTIEAIVQNPELTTYVTLLPVEKLGVDAAILFADLSTPFSGLGFPTKLVEGKGPVVENPIRSPGDLKRLREFSAEEETPYVLEAIRMLKAELEVPLIGFAGAPFTLASYLIEGGPSKHFVATKRFMYHHPKAFEALLSHLARAMAAYLKAQAQAGADVLMVFDSWVGRLTQEDYATYVRRPTAMLFKELEGLRPTIHFGTGTNHLLELMKEAGGDAIGVDTTTPLDEARERLGGTPVQGNLDPARLFAPEEVLLAGVDQVLEANLGRPGHIFNLGHGILPGTPEENVRRVVEHVHERTQG